MEHSYSSNVSKRLYFWILFFGVPMLVSTTWIMLVKQPSIWPVTLVVFCIVVFFIVVFQTMRLSINNGLLIYRSIFRKVVIEVSNIDTYGVFTIYMPKTPAGKLAFVFKEKNGDEHYLPINMFKESKVKEMSKYLVSQGAKLSSDGKFTSERAMGNFYQ